MCRVAGEKNVAVAYRRISTVPGPRAPVYVGYRGLSDGGVTNQCCQGADLSFLQRQPPTLLISTLYIAKPPLTTRLSDRITMTYPLCIVRVLGNVLLQITTDKSVLACRLSNETSH